MKWISDNHIPCQQNLTKYKLIHFHIFIVRSIFCRPYATKCNSVTVCCKWALLRQFMGKKSSRSKTMVSLIIVFDLPFFLLIQYLICDIYSPLLEVNKIFDDGVYVFPLRNTTNQPCVYESLMLIHNVSDLNVCFSLSSDTSNIPYR